MRARALVRIEKAESTLSRRVSGRLANRWRRTREKRGGDFDWLAIFTSRPVCVDRWRQIISMPAFIEGRDRTERVVFFSNNKRAVDIRACAQVINDNHPNCPFARAKSSPYEQDTALQRCLLLDVSFLYLPISICFTRSSAMDTLKSIRLDGVVGRISFCRRLFMLTLFSHINGRRKRRRKKKGGGNVSCSHTGSNEGNIYGYSIVLLHMDQSANLRTSTMYLSGNQPKGKESRRARRRRRGGIGGGERTREKWRAGKRQE